METQSVGRAELAQLHEWIDDRARRDLFSGAVLVRQGTETLLEHAAGLAHRGHQVPVSVGTRFQVASVGKMITATTALLLVEDGELRLDQPLTDVLPAELRPVGMDDRHTLHHLLSHTSGLANYFDDDDETLESFVRALERIPASRARRPTDLLPLIVELPMTSELGKYVYCDTNFVLVGILIEHVTGRSFADLAIERVLEPVGMTASGFFDVDLEPAGFATGYRVTDEPAERWRSNVYGLTASAMPDGGMTSTVHDLDRFMAALRTGTLLEPATLAAMLTPHGIADNGVDACGYSIEMAIEQDRTTVYGHSGWDPGVAAYVAYFVDADVTVVVLCNLDRGAWAVIEEILRPLDLHDPRD